MTPRGIPITRGVCLLLGTLSLAAAERSAVSSSGGVRKAKRQPPKKLEVHAFAAASPGLTTHKHV